LKSAAQRGGDGGEERRALELRLQESEAEKQRLAQQLTSQQADLQFNLKQPLPARRAQDQEVIDKLSKEKNELNNQLTKTWARINEQTRKIEDERLSFWEELQSRVVAPSMAPPPPPSLNHRSNDGKTLSSSSPALVILPQPSQVRAPTSARGTHPAQLRVGTSPSSRSSFPVTRSTRSFGGAETCLSPPLSPGTPANDAIISGHSGYYPSSQQAMTPSLSESGRKLSGSTFANLTRLGARVIPRDLVPMGSSVPTSTANVRAPFKF